MNPLAFPWDFFFFLQGTYKRKYEETGRKNSKICSNTTIILVKYMSCQVQIKMQFLTKDCRVFV